IKKLQEKKIDYSNYRSLLAK
ncbi:DUF2621 domain-containing protein, partial [Bacillus cereus]